MSLVWFAILALAYMLLVVYSAANGFSIPVAIGMCACLFFLVRIEDPQGRDK